MSPRLSIEDRATLLNVTLDVPREHDHVVQSITLHPTGEMEIRLDPLAPGQRISDLERFQAEKRRRRRNA